MGLNTPDRIPPMIMTMSSRLGMARQMVFKVSLTLSFCPVPEVSGKPQHHPDGRRPEAALHLHGVRCAMLNFFIGFAFFEAGAIFGFFVAALMQAAQSREIGLNGKEDSHG